MLFVCVSKGRAQTLALSHSSDDLSRTFAMQEEAAKRKGAAAAAAAAGVAGPTTTKRPARISKLMPAVGGATAGSSRLGWGKANDAADRDDCAGGLGNLKGMSKLSSKDEGPKTLGGGNSKMRGFMDVNIPDQGKTGKADVKKTAKLTLGRPGGAFGGARRGRGRGRGRGIRR